jgi:bifunctional non-homologous end joining protein LigD
VFNCFLATVDITSTFPAIAKTLLNQQHDFVLDGETIAFSENGTVDFENLQNRWLISDPVRAAEQNLLNPTAFYGFDILRFNGASVIQENMLQRKSLLHKHFQESELAKLVAHFEDGMTLYESCRMHQFEGIVAKRADSLYKPGIRSKDWIKIKFTAKDIFAIVGHVEGEGFLLGHYGIEGFKIVGTVQYGFSTADYEQLSKRLQQIPASTKSRKPTVWFKPNVSVEIEFMEWTSKRTLRFPVFKGFV